MAWTHQALRPVVEQVVLSFLLLLLLLLCPAPNTENEEISSCESKEKKKKKEALRRVQWLESEFPIIFHGRDSDQ